jgi:hypothetical protein
LPDGSIEPCVEQSRVTTIQRMQLNATKMNQARFLIPVAPLQEWLQGLCTISDRAI